MNITINTNLAETLTRLASGQGMTDEQYVTNYMEAYLRSKYKEQVVSKISSSSVDEIREYEQVIVAKEAEILTNKQLLETPIVVNEDLRPV